MMPVFCMYTNYAFCKIFGLKSIYVYLQGHTNVFLYKMVKGKLLYNLLFGTYFNYFELFFSNKMDIRC